MAVNAGVAILLAPVIGFIAAALGTTLAGWTMTTQLWWGKHHMGEAATFDERLKNRVPRLLLSAVLMGVVLWIAARALGPMLHEPLQRYAALALLVLIGGASYALAAVLTGGVRLKDLKSSLGR
jgi:putative peptidoglycan lipid II flippase